MALKQDFQIGNSFDTQTLALGHAKKVWRRIDEQLPGGYHVTNLTDFAAAGYVQSGTPVALSTADNADERDIVAIPFATIADIYDGSDESGEASSIDELNIIGFLQEDVPATATNYGTGNVIVKGEIYGYMLGKTKNEADAVKAAVKTMTQKNGMSIRVID